MPETPDPAQHVRPFVYEDLTTKALHFSISEIQSRMDVRNPYALDLEYTQTMMGFLLFLPEPRRIAMIGLGGGSLAKSSRWSRSIRTCSRCASTSTCRRMASGSR